EQVLGAGVDEVRGERERQAADLEETQHVAADRADDDDLAHADAGLDHRAPDVAELHARAAVADEEAEHDDDRRGERRRRLGLPVQPEHRADDRGEWREEDPASLEYRAHRRDLAPIDAPDPRARGLQIAPDEE